MWINTQLEVLFGLRQRWEEIRREAPSPHLVRPRGYTGFANDFPMGGGADWAESWLHGSGRRIPPSLLGHPSSALSPRCSGSALVPGEVLDSRGS